MSPYRTWIRTCLPVLVAACAIGHLPVAARADTLVSSCDLWMPSEPAHGQAWFMNGVGKQHFKITTRSGVAQKFFDQGLALLQDGWPFEADRAFARVEQLDPQCAMAQWGLAMTALNGARRDSAIARARRLAETASVREQLYIAAVATRNAGGSGSLPGVFGGTSEGYRRELRKIVDAYSDDMTARLLLAEALVAGYETDGTPRPGTLEAIALCEGVLAKDPSNAGANHTLAHAYQSSPTPEKGARAADLFAKAAPAVPHAIHLSGELALRINRNDDAIRAFQTAATMDEAYMRKDDETTDHASGPYSHNLYLLVAAYGDQGRYREALNTTTRLLDTARQPREAANAAALDGRLALLRLMVRFERWNEILDGHSLPDDGGFEVMKPWRHYALGRAWLGRGSLNRAWSELVALDQAVRRLNPQLPKSAALRPLQERQTLALQIAPLELKGRILVREKMAIDGLAALRQALDLERRLALSEPQIFPHIGEAQGDVALDLKRWDDAVASYRAVLAREPDDGRALLGLARALEGAGKRQEAAEARAEFSKLWAHADPEVVPGSQGSASASPKVESPAAPAPAAQAAAAPEPPSEPPPRTQAPESAPVARAPRPKAAAPAVKPVAAATPEPAEADPWAGKLKKTKINGAQLAYVDVGKGQPIVLVHGALSDYRQWAPQIEALSKRYRVVAYSRRYHYPNPPAGDHADYSYELNEADLVGLIRALHLGKVHLLGHGYGGFVATLVARDHPDMVRTLMLAEPGVYSMIPWKKDRKAAIEGLRAAAASSGEAARAGDVERAAKEFYGVVQGSPDAYDSLPEAQRRIMRDNAGTLLLGIEPPPSFPCEQVHRLVTRTLLIEGDATTRNEHAALEGLDRCLPNRFRAFIKDASRVVNCGNPDAFNEAVTQFIEAPEAPTHLTEDEP